MKLTSTKSATSSPRRKDNAVRCNVKRWSLAALVLAFGCNVFVLNLQSELRRDVKGRSSATTDSDKNNSNNRDLIHIPGVPSTASLPSIMLTCRLTTRFEDLSKKTLLSSFETFWPKASSWPSASLAMIWDEESEEDHITADTYPDYVQHLFEPPPPNGTLCGKMRGLGYDRQQYSNFVQDRLFMLPSAAAQKSSVPEFLGFLDSDSFFNAAVHPSDLFDWDNERQSWKPRVLGYNGCCIPWSSMATVHAIGKRPAGMFMVVIGFPIIIKTEHLPYIRQRMVERLVGTKDNNNDDEAFDQAFRNVCDYPGGYSQFDIMMNILWDSLYRDEYSWTLRDQANSNHGAFIQTLNDDAEVLAKDDFRAQIPRMGLMHHAEPFMGDKYAPKFVQLVQEAVNSGICLYNDENRSCLDPSRHEFCRKVVANHKELFTDWRRGNENPAINSIVSFEKHRQRVFCNSQAWPWLANTTCCDRSMTQSFSDR